MSLRRPSRSPQASARTLYLARPLACRTNDNWTTDVARTVTPRTLFGTIDGDVCRQAIDCFLKRERQRHLDVGASLRLWTRRFLFFRSSATEQVREDVAKGTSRTARPGRSTAAPIKPCEIETRRRTSARWTSASGCRVGEIVGILSEAIVNTSLLRIRQDVVRFRHHLEAFLGCFVTRIHIGVILARQTPVSLLDLFRLGVALDAEYFVIVLLISHRLQHRRFSKHCRLIVACVVHGLTRDSGQRPIGNWQSGIGNNLICFRQRRRIQRRSRCRHRNRSTRTTHPLPTLDPQPALLAAPVDTALPQACATHFEVD